MGRFLVWMSALGFVLVGGGATIGARLIWWIHPALWALVMVVGTALATVGAAYGLPALVRALRDGLRPGPSPDPLSPAVWRLAERALHAGGLLGLLMGLIVTAQVLDLGYGHAGAKLGACLVPPFLSVVLGLGARALRLRCAS